MSKSWSVLGAGVVGVCVGIAVGCQSRIGVKAAATHPAAVATTTQSAAATASAWATGISATDLRDILADLAKAHADKIRLSGWAGTPFLPVNGAFKPFFQNMSKQNKELDAELKEWAKEHHVNLTYHYSDDVEGRALKMMEDRQEKGIRGDQQQDFERDILMEMSNDYEWHLCQVKALVPLVRDAKLKGYLEKCAVMFEGGSWERRGLLRRYRFQ